MAMSAPPNWSVWPGSLLRRQGAEDFPTEVFFTTVEGAREGHGDAGHFRPCRSRSVWRAPAPANTMRVGAAILLIAAATPTVNIVPCGGVVGRRGTKR